MEQPTFDFTTFIAEQAPVVVLMGAVVYFGFKYFRNQIESYQKIIAKKDDDLKQINREGKEDLQKSFSVLQDVNSTLKSWLDKDGENFDLKKNIAKSLSNLELVSGEILRKLDK